MKAAIYQIFFDSHSRSKLDPLFKPFDNSACPRPSEREIYVFKEGLRRYPPVADEHIGFLSWKFYQKSQLRGEELFSFLEKQNDVDIVLINPFPTSAIFYKNPWHQSEAHHPHLKTLASKIFQKAGLNTNFLDEVFDSKIICYCNYFTATSTFWNQYLSFIQDLEMAIANLDPADKSIFESLADNAISANHYSFFFERCLSTFLHLNPHIKTCSMSLLNTELNRVSERQRDNIRLAFEVRESIDNEKDKHIRIKSFEKIKQLQKNMPAPQTLHELIFTLKYKLRTFFQHPGTIIKKKGPTS